MFTKGRKSYGLGFKIAFPKLPVPTPIGKSYHSCAAWAAWVIQFKPPAPREFEGFQVKSHRASRQDVAATSGVQNVGCGQKALCQT